MRDIRDSRWQTASRSLQPRPRLRPGLMATHSAATTKPSVSKSKFGTTEDVRKEALRNHLLSKDGQRNEITSPYVSLGQDLMRQRKDSPDYAYSGKPPRSNLGYDSPAAANSIRHLPTSVYDRNIANPIRKDARSADGGWPPRPESVPRPSSGIIRGVLGETEASLDSVTPARGRLKRDYTAFDTHHGRQQEQDIEPNAKLSSTSYSMLPEMQNTPLSGSSAPEGITDQQRASPVPAMYVRNATPPSPPPEAKYQCDFPDCHKSFVRKELYERHKNRHTVQGSPEGPNSNKQQTTTGHTPSHKYQIDVIDERNDRVGKIARNVISSSAYRFPREKLKYTISEDCTVDPRKRQRICLIALEQPVKSKSQAMHAEQPNTPSHEFVRQGPGAQQKNIEVYPQNLAHQLHQHRTSESGISSPQGMNPASRSASMAPTSDHLDTRVFTRPLDDWVNEPDVSARLVLFDEDLFDEDYLRGLEQTDDEKYLQGLRF